MMIKGIVFDLDGTLIDTAKILAESWEKAFISENIHVNYEEIYKNTKGISSKDIVKKYKKDSNPNDVLRIKEKRKENFIKLLDKNKILYPETISVLERLKLKGIKTAIGTGMSNDLLKRVLDITSLKDFVNAVVSSDDVKNGKPSPDIFIEAFKRINVEPNLGMVVGDSLNDVDPGKKIGAFTVFISREGEKLDYADANIINLEEIFKFI